MRRHVPDVQQLVESADPQPQERQVAHQNQKHPRRFELGTFLDVWCKIAPPERADNNVEKVPSVPESVCEQHDRLAGRRLTHFQYAALIGPNEVPYASEPVSRSFLSSLVSAALPLAITSVLRPACHALSAVPPAWVDGLLCTIARPFTRLGGPIASDDSSSRKQGSIHFYLNRGRREGIICVHTFCIELSKNACEH